MREAFDDLIQRLGVATLVRATTVALTPSIGAAMIAQPLRIQYLAGAAVNFQLIKIAVRTSGLDQCC